VRTYRDDLTWKVHQLLAAEGYLFCNELGYLTDYSYYHPNRTFGLVSRKVRVNRGFHNLWMGEFAWLATLSIEEGDTPRARLSVHGDSFAERFDGIAELLRTRLGIHTDVAVVSPRPRYAEYCPES
jgi:hypothetical protein